MLAGSSFCTTAKSLVPSSARSAIFISKPALSFQHCRHAIFGYASFMAGSLEFTLNGRRVRVEDCSPNTTLLEYLRGIGLTGSKEGCAEGDCGACSLKLCKSALIFLQCFG